MSDKKSEIIEKLNSVRATTKSVVAGLSEAQWAQALYAEDAHWTVLDLLRHAVNAEPGMIAWMKQVQAGGEGVPADFDLNRWNDRIVQKNQGKTAVDLLADMETNRASLLAFMDTIQEEDWGKVGRHASMLMLSIEQVCHVIADHEAGHVEEIRQATA